MINTKKNLKKLFPLTLFTDSHSEIEKIFENYFDKFLKKAKTKITYHLGDFNLNLLNHDTSLKIKYGLFS